jgi:regulator of protease activity HflC (stomatin/prohibitin superfamily)
MQAIRWQGSNPRDPAPRRPYLGLGVVLGGLTLLIGAVVAYNSCIIEITTGKQAVLIRKTGLDLAENMEIAPLPDKSGRIYKGVQPGVLTEGRYFYNPIFWSWEIRDQIEIPKGKIGVRIALTGEPMPAGQILAEPGQKGIQRDVLMPRRYAYNWYAEAIEIHDQISVPAGFLGVQTFLAGPLPKDPNVPLVGKGERGVQKETLPPRSYPLNPYAVRVSMVDCRSKRFNLSKDMAMDFLSADGFPVTIDGAIEFRVIPEEAARVFVLYNEDHNGDEIHPEIEAKIISPESRSICRIGGSKLTGGQFINGVDREMFQQNLDKSLKKNCREQGIEILAVAITSITPPDAIATPVRQREVAKQQLAQFQQEKLQQISEAQLKVQELLADQKRAVVEADQAVVEQMTKTEQEQSVAKTLAEQKLAVVQTNLEAVKAKASAIISEAEAAADVMRAKNKAELAGLGARVKAFGGDGSAVAQNILLGKLAPAFRTIMASTEGPLMELFGQFNGMGKYRSTPAPATSSATSAASLPAHVFPTAEVKP